MIESIEATTKGKTVIIDGVEYPVTVCKPSRKGKRRQQIRCKDKPWRDLVERRKRQGCKANASNRSMRS